ncbi:MAG TPA: hypothetical protein VFE51_04490 [Verrucomicrobiae bacterium]|nr:hypothetical protein [Verrucomicrobiae bacterium]
MRAVLGICAGALICSGCAGHRGGAASFSELGTSSRPAVSLPSDQVIITPDTQLAGKVSRVNQDGRFVVMTFPIGHLPTLNQRLNVYRGGVKVGEIRVTGPQLDDNVVGDIGAGDAQAGDEVRGQ